MEGSFSWFACWRGSVVVVVGAPGRSPAFCFHGARWGRNIMRVTRPVQTMIVLFLIAFSFLFAPPGLADGFGKRKNLPSVGGGIHPSFWFPRTHFFWDSATIYYKMILKMATPVIMPDNRQISFRVEIMIKGGQTTNISVDGMKIQFSLTNGCG